MGILDWIRPPAKQADAPADISRRDFFARVAGKTPDRPAVAGENVATPNALYTFHVAGFPYYDGPVRVPALRPDQEFELVPEPDHPTNPDAVRIQWRKDHLGYVPSELSPDVRQRLAKGERLLCRATRIDPSADLTSVLEVSISSVPPEPESPQATEGRTGAI